MTHFHWQSGRLGMVVLNWNQSLQSASSPTNTTAEVNISYICGRTNVYVIHCIHTKNYESK